MISNDLCVYIVKISRNCCLREASFWLTMSNFHRYYLFFHTTLTIFNTISLVGVARILIGG